MLPQEWAAIRTISWWVYNRRNPEIHNEMSVDVLLISWVAGNGVRVCHHGDWTWSSPTILRRRQLDRKLSFWWLQSIATMHYQWTVNKDCKLSATVQFLSIWRCTIYWGTTFQLPGNFNSWHHGLMSNSWLWVIVVALHQTMKKLNQLNYIFLP